MGGLLPAMLIVAHKSDYNPQLLPENLLTTTKERKPLPRWPFWTVLFSVSSFFKEIYFPFHLDQKFSGPKVVRQTKFKY
jgi:hypothetical protein